jgi:hypothetical protein
VVKQLVDAVAIADVHTRVALAGAPLVEAGELDDLLLRSSLIPPDPVATARLEDLWHVAAAAVDEPLLYGTALMLARAIDESLPALRTLHAPRVDAIAGCDVLERLPQLCIGGDGDNVYSADAILLIDLGGNDVHTHSAGAGNPAFGGGAAGVTIDVAGDDRYIRAAGPAQGAGNLSIGVLVDAAGNDTYSIATTQGNVATVGQGSNHSSGVGILADLDGADSYAITNTKRDQTTASGQGRGTQPGFGLLLDDGAGNDSYLVSAHQPGPVESATEVKIGGINAGGQGMGGIGGVGILSDGGGSDTMAIDVIAAVISPDETRPVTSVPITGPSGQGAGGVGGVGLMRTGPGDTVRRLVGSQQGPWSGITGGNGYGWGSSGSGALIDEGGDDRYTIDVSSTAAHHVRILDGCECEGGSASARQSIPNWASAGVSGFGYGAGGSAAGFGLLRDEGGDDRYSAIVRAQVDAAIEDERTIGAGMSDALALASAVSMYVQGVGHGGDGILIDEAGDDVYEAAASTSARATATAVSPDVEVAARARAGRVFSDAQAAGNALGGVPGRGILRDLGGADRYTVSSESLATSSPATEATTDGVLSSAQASVNGNSVAFLQDVDASLSDAFNLAPADPACEGTRGQGEWRDCGAGVGSGRVEDE